MDLLVGSTGFVGGNLRKSHRFSMECHSTDVNCAYGLKPDLCVYAGVPSAMFLANTNPEEDLSVIKKARKNLREIAPKKVVLISTIAVYDDTKGRNETSTIDEEQLQPYGKNRRTLEKWVLEDFSNSLIIRLPALYGAGLKKNFLFDLHTVTPSMLNETKYKSLREKSALVEKSYLLKNDGFYHLADKANREELRVFFENNGFNALSFTDERSKFQFYNLGRLWNDVMLALENGLTMLNICTPPVSAKEVYSVVKGKNDWSNIMEAKPFDYDLRSIYAELLNGNDGYICSREEELRDIKQFMELWKD